MTKESLSSLLEILRLLGHSKVIPISALGVVLFLVKRSTQVGMLFRPILSKLAAWLKGILNVAAINAASASITGNQSISGVFTATGQAKLNGGAALGNKKVTGLLDATLSATSTEAVNGAQLNTIKQKLASVGKTYSAGSDVAISSANAISVAKKGVVDKGDTGIVTGGTVYKITSALNSSLGTLKASVSAHQSTLTTLTQGLSDLKASVTNINQSVASATKSLSSQLNNRLQSDMGNLSNDGKNVIRSMVSSTLKSLTSMRKHLAMQLVR